MAVDKFETFKLKAKRPEDNGHCLMNQNVLKLLELFEFIGTVLRAFPER